MEQAPERRSRRKVWLGIAAVAGLIIVVAIVAFVLVNSIKKEEPAAANDTDSAQQTASKDQVQQNLKDLDTSIEAAKEDQTSASEALNEGLNPEKVGN